MKMMSKFSPIILLALLCGLFSLSSCSLNKDDSGELGQYWHLMAVDTLATNGSCDVSARRVFWTFQGTIMQAYDFTEQKIYCLHYDHSGSTLKLYEPRVNDRTKGDPLVEDASVLHPLGIHALEENYEVEEIDGSTMVLADTIYRLHFRAQ